MRVRTLVPALCLTIAATLLPAGQAWADAIDGDWCAPPGDGGGRIISINGPRVITPGGTQMSGDYTRHSFTYTVPASEPAAGTAVVMNQLNEQAVQVREGAEGQARIWNRCSRPTS